MPQYYRTAATKLKKELYEQFQELCEKKGVTVNMLLKEHIEADLEGNKNERTGEGLDQNGPGNIQGRSGGDTQELATFRKEWGKDCPFC